MGIAFCVWIVYNKITPAVCVGSHILNHNFYKGLRVLGRDAKPPRLRIAEWQAAFTHPV